MADALGLDQADERELARAYESARLADRRAQQRQQGPVRSAAATGMAAISGTASQAATAAYTQLWERAQIAVEGVNMSFFGAGAIVAGLPTVGLYLIRLIFGNLFGGFGSFTFQGIRVPRVPGYTWITGIYHTGVVLLLLAVAAAISFGVLLVYFLIADPATAALLGFCKLFGWIINFFGATSCPAI